MEKKLHKSIADFQQEVPVILKDTQGYGYTYTDLPAIFKVINPLLKKYNLGFTQMPTYFNEGIPAIKTVVFHTETGEQIESVMPIPQGVQLKGMNDFQVLGSAITYLRRYALSSMLGLVTDKDTDGAGEQVKRDWNKEVSIIKTVDDLKAFYLKNKGAGKDLDLAVNTRKLELNASL